MGLAANGQSIRPHLDPNHWCDMIVEQYRKPPDVYPDTFIAAVFTCPRGHASPDLWSRLHEARASVPSPPVDTWTSDYAMNPNCREGSPKDMVFVFESKPGWNQHGGPDLFTFDNHDPKGGLVLLNDGTVKFIRTEEELKQLRWK
jgi:hypothetical protein